MGDRLITLNSNTKIPRLEQYLGVWAIEECAFEAIASLMNRFDLDAHLADSRNVDFKSAAMPPIQITENGVAIIPVEGTLTKHGGSLTGVGIVGLRRQLRLAADDESVSAIVLKIDSPGGTAKGIGDFVQDIVETRATKPVWAYIEDWAASAAYVIASATDRIVSSSTATVIGSLGVFTVLHDSSEAAERQGIKVHVVKSAKFKGSGEPGTEITDDQLSEVDRHVRDIHNMLILGIVGKNRAAAGLDINAVDDGRVWVASDAKALGLIDEINTLDGVVENIVTIAGPTDPSTGTGVTIMAENTVTDGGSGPVAATIRELRSAFPNADAQFHLDCLDKQQTMQEAQASYIQVLQSKSKSSDDRMKELADETAELKDSISAAKAKPGGDPVADKTTGSAASSGPRTEWDELVEKHAAKFGGDRFRGAIAANRERPDLRMQVDEMANG